MCPITEIEVGDRRREDYGDIAGLAQSIRRYGLIHPVVVDSEKRLIAGGRRLEAARLLGWQQIECRDFGTLSEAERREIELEENLRRKDLTPYEQARELVRKAPVIAEAISGTLPEKAPQGRPAQYAAPKEDIAQALGTSERELVRAEQHVATASAYPFMQQPVWKQYHVLEARESLQKLPEAERAKAVALVDQPGVPPRKALEIVRNLAEMPGEQRERVFTLAESEDPREKTLALTEAAALPPCPDPRLCSLHMILQDLRGPIKAFDDEPASLLRQAYRLIESAIKGIHSLDKERNDGATHPGR